MRARIIAIVFAALCSLSTHATTFTTDASDLWWNPNESGWGVNVVQQYDTLFLTFFVYGSNGSPTWYVAPANVYSSTAGSPTIAYTGTLYQTTGPWFAGATFNPSAVGATPVGTATFTLESVEGASLSYTVNGVSVFKALRRQTWRSENLTGSYLGASIGTYTGCASNGYAEEPAYISISQSGASFSMTSQFTQNGVTCNYSGTYSQNGHMGNITGNVSCTNGGAGTFNAFEIEVNPSGITARAATTFGSCRWSGHLGGLRRSS